MKPCRRYFSSASSWEKSDRGERRSGLPGQSSSAPYLNEATYLVSEGVPSRSSISALLDFGMPMGPMELIDEVGVDVGAKVAHILHDAFGERMLPCPMNEKVVAAGQLGKKSGKGFMSTKAKARR